jgi:hypothetical protein
MLNKLMLWFKGTERLLSLAQPTKLDIRCGSAYSNNHEDLGYHKTCARWVPKQLTDEHRWTLCGNVRAIFAVTSWRRRDFPAMDCHKQWNMGAPLGTCKQTSKHGVEVYIITHDQGIQKCAFCWPSDIDTALGL